jgi:hypothetical protein
VSHCKVDVEHANQLRVAENHLADVVAGERLLPEPGLDLVKNLHVARVVLVER